MYHLVINWLVVWRLLYCISNSLIITSLQCTPVSVSVRVINLSCKDFSFCYPWRSSWNPLMMTSSNGNISAWLAICAGNSPFPAQRQVTRSFDVVFDLRLNKRLSKQSWGWWFETILHPLWSHSNVGLICFTFYISRDFHWLPFDRIKGSSLAYLFYSFCSMMSFGSKLLLRTQWPTFVYQFSGTIPELIHVISVVLVCVMPQ